MGASWDVWVEDLLCGGVGVSWVCEFMPLVKPSSNKDVCHGQAFYVGCSTV